MGENEEINIIGWWNYGFIFFFLIKGWFLHSKVKVLLLFCLGGYDYNKEGEIFHSIIQH